MKVSNAIKLFTSQLARNLTLVFAGNFLAAGLGFLSVLIISRALSVSDFGLFNMAISVILIVPYLATLGMDTSMIKFASSYLSTGKITEATQVFRETLFVRVITSTIIAIVIYSTAPLLSKRIFHYPNLVPLIRLAAFGVLSVPLFNYVKSALYIYRLFKDCVMLQLLVDFAKLFTVGILIFSLKLNTFSAVAVFTFIPLLGVLFGFWQIRPKLFSKGKSPRSLFGQLLSYSKWVFVSNVCATLFLYIAIFMLAKMLGIKATGIYGLALNLTYIFPIIIISLKSVLLPEVSRFSEIAQFEKYIKGSLKISLFLTVLVIPFLFISEKIIPCFFGSRYLDSVAIFNWLLLSYIFRTISSPIRSALYSLNKPHIIAFVELFRVTAMILGCYLLIPSFGILVPAVLALIINVSVLGFLILYVFKYIHQEKVVFQKEELAELTWL